MKTQSIIKKAQELKNLLVSLSVIVAIILGFIMYFAPAAELADFKQQYYEDKRWSRMEYLDRRIADIEFNYGCYSKQECADLDMPVSVHKGYVELKNERERLITFLEEGK